MPAVVISMEAARVENALLLDSLTSEVALEEPEIGSTEPNILIYNNCTNDELHLGMMAGGSGVFDDEGDDSDMCDAIPTPSQCRLPTTERERFGLGASADDGYDGTDCNNADADEEEEASQATDGSTQNVKD